MASKLEPRLSISIRPIRPEDRKLIVDAVAYASDRTYYRRFHGPRHGFSPRELSELTEIDGYNHFALIATERDRPDRLVRVARFVRYRDHPTEAEFAITVHDPYQGQGIGGRLLELLVEAARERGIRRLRALIQSDNDAMMRLLRRVLPQARVEERDGPECTYGADIVVSRVLPRKAPRPRARPPGPMSTRIRRKVAPTRMGTRGARRHHGNRNGDAPARLDDKRES